ncbi:hypothetical protein IMZ31_22300 (plasmid) [Pontibacillus sp. ALD_SL1]|uniref:hypothetical protein n=1 Tax=Pontibacillus sp. ALD_SL1 TaxID=2777185 RepID=UPI001A97B9B7|nr:hypothetical protein [Pontibacillus sp. ALD_SL1]QST02187.1 hypothetical protein IMZ31_22300 [Pontibacillus sp. ALD_SL1]
MHKKSNSSKSRSGNRLNQIVEEALTGLKEKGTIQDYIKEPRYAHKGYSYPQYRPDFVIFKKDETVFVDNTTTIRSDRVKQKQFDAFGVKHALSHSGKAITYYIAIPDLCHLGTEKTNEKEISHYEREKKKISEKHIFSFIDDILPFSQLIESLSKTSVAEDVEQSLFLKETLIQAKKEIKEGKGYTSDEMRKFIQKRDS